MRQARSLAVVAVRGENVGCGGMLVVGDAVILVGDSGEEVVVGLGDMLSPPLGHAICSSGRGLSSGAMKQRGCQLLVGVGDGLVVSVVEAVPHPDRSIEQVNIPTVNKIRLFIE